MTGDQAIRELLALDYRFFRLASQVPGLHPCAAEQLHADYAIASDYARLIACVRGSTLDELLTSDARERILSVRQTLRELSAMLGQAPGKNGAGAEFQLAAPVARPAARKAAPAKRASAAPVKRAAKSKKK